MSKHKHVTVTCEKCRTVYHGPVCWGPCWKPCESRYVYQCILEAGHKGKHVDWTDLTWLDSDGGGAMAKRCEHCRYWQDSVFKGESASGWGVWWGDCTAGVDRGPNHHSLYPACEKFELREDEPDPAAREAGG